MENGPNNFERNLAQVPFGGEYVLKSKSGFSSESARTPSMPTAGKLRTLPAGVLIKEGGLLGAEPGVAVGVISVEKVGESSFTLSSS